MSKYSYIDDLSKWRSEFKFSIDIVVRFSETDMFGHMNNVSSFIYFEEARIAFMKNIKLFNIHDQQTDIPVVVDLKCDYHAQVFFGDEIKLYVKANRVGNSSVDIHYMAINAENKICFTGRGNLVKMNVKSGKSIPFSEEEREMLIGEKSII